jgi:hypothetical protein
LDLVAASKTQARVEKDIFDVVREQILFAFIHNNLDNLYHPAPPEVWRESYNAKQIEEPRRIRPVMGDKDITPEIPPPWIVSNIRANDPYYVD